MNAVNVNQILVNILLGVATALGTTLIPFLIGLLRKKLAQSQSELTMTVYDEVSQVVLDCVKEAQQTLVAETKAKTSDGKITRDEAISIKDVVLNKSLTLLNNKTIKLIGSEGQNVNELVSTIIESQLRDVKLTEEAVSNGEVE